MSKLAGHDGAAAPGLPAIVMLDVRGGGPVAHAIEADH